MAAIFNGSAKAVSVSAGGGLATSWNIVGWVKFTTIGTNPMLMGQDEDANSIQVYAQNAEKQFFVRQEYATTFGRWRSDGSPAGTNLITTARWLGFGVTFSRASGQKPSFYLYDPTGGDTQALLRGRVEIQAPSGAFTVANTGYVLGNLNAGGRGLDGKLAYMQFFSAGLLSQSEVDNALKNPGTVRTDLLAWYLPAISNLLDSSGFGRDFTGTSVTFDGDAPTLTIPHGPSNRRRRR